MANEKMLGETKKVLEMMEESEEKVSALNQDLKQNETLCLQIKQNLKELRELNNKSTADLEDNQNLKSTIKNYNEELVTCAQQIYTCGQELYVNLSLRENELDKVEEMLNKNEDKFLAKLNYYELEEEKLKAELESQTLNAEYEELTNELSNINMEIKQYENSVKEDEELSRLETEYRKEIATMEESVELINIEIDTIAELLKNTAEKRQISIKNTEDHITDLDKQIDEVQNEIIVATKILAENKAGIGELNSKIKDIECNSQKKQEEYNQHNKELHSIGICMKKAKDNMLNEVDYCEKSILEYEELFKIQKELNDKLIKEITSFKIKIEVEDVENKKILMDISSLEERKAKLDLREELDTKQNELKQLKATRHSLKGQYNSKYLEIQTEIKTVQEEIDSIELKNKNLQNEIDQMVFEINQMKNNEEEKTKEKHNHAEQSKELDTQVQNLTFEIARAKAESIKNKQKTADSNILATPKHFLIPSTSNKEKRKKIQHNWDSDSSIEGENRRFSELAKQKIKIKRHQGNKS